MPYLSNMRFGFIYYFWLALGLTSGPGYAQLTPGIGEELLNTTHYTHKDIVPDSIFLDVEVEIYENDNLMEVQFWEEWIFKPGIRIVKKKILSEDSLIYRGDSLYLLRFHELIYEQAKIDLLTLMTLGLYWEAPEHFLKIIKGMKIDLGEFGSAYRWGRKKWVLGAEFPGEVNEIWIDQEDMNVTRVFYFNYPQQKRQEIEWEEFESIGGFKFPKRVIISQGLDRLMIKKYRITRVVLP
jgi:hypothetical protein